MSFLANLSPKAKATLKRWAKATLLGSAALALDGLVTVLTNNGLGLNPTASTLAVTYLVPFFIGAEKWLNWQEAQ